MKIPGLPPVHIPAAIRIPLADVARRRQAWSGPLGEPTAGDGRLTGVENFGSNPGNLRMLRYVPPGLPTGAPIVVALHGCTQRGGAFDEGTGWSRLAERHRFTLLVPEQRPGNNHNLCFNWFEIEDSSRDHGEAASINAMVSATAAELHSDPARVFVTGLSAGGAMTAAMLATYPDVFAAGAIIAGLPYRAATNASEAFGAMYHCPALPASEWGAKVRQASPIPQRKPIVSIWHGDADTTVKPGAANQSARQWCNVHGISHDASTSDLVDGVPHQAWRDGTGVIRVEQYCVPLLKHGVPVTPGAEGDHGVGQCMPFILEAPISSTWHIARSWGLVPHETTTAAKPGRPSVALSPVDAFRQAFKF